MKMCSKNLFSDDLICKRVNYFFFMTEARKRLILQNIKNIKLYKF